MNMKTADNKYCFAAKFLVAFVYLLILLTEMALVPRSVSLVFNSDATTGAQNINSTLSAFEVTLNDPLSVPRDAVECTAAITNAAIWNTAYNISASFNNNKLRFTTSVAPAGVKTLTIADGLYSVAGLNAAISTLLINLTLPGTLITISGDDATGKSIVNLSTAGDSIDFTFLNSVREVLGFNSAVITAPSAGYSFFSDNVAQFNRINSWVIASNLVPEGISVDNRTRGIIGQINIVAKVGKQDSYSPQNLTSFDASSLVGASRTNLRFELLDQNLRAVSMPDTFQFTVKISWYMRV